MEVYISWVISRKDKKKKKEFVTGELSLLELFDNSKGIKYCFIHRFI